MKLTDARAILEGAGCILVDEGTVTAVNAVQEASDIIHQSFSDFVKERQMNEGFFKDKYTKYKDAVISILKKEFGMVFPSEKNHALEDWIRDYFVDKFDETDCAKAIRDNFRKEFACESVEELEDAGFIVEGIRDGEDPEFARSLRKRFQEGMPEGCLVKQVFAANGEAVIRFAGYPRSSKLEIVWEYFDEDGSYSIYIDSKEAHSGVAIDIPDLIEQVRDFFAPSYWFTRRTH